MRFSGVSGEDGATYEVPEDGAARSESQQLGAKKIDKRLISHIDEKNSPDSNRAKKLIRQ